MAIAEECQFLLPYLLVNPPLGTFVSSSFVSRVSNQGRVEEKTILICAYAPNGTGRLISQGLTLRRVIKTSDYARSVGAGEFLFLMPRGCVYDMLIRIRA